jgi:Na+-transporting NADH:ubiquinone oxidoreductase subunit NqrC
VALLLWAILVSSQNSKLSSLQAQQAQLNSQQLALQAKLSGLKSEKQQVPNSCADLQKIATQIPSVQSPTDIDAEESSFESQFNALTASTGVVLTQFSGFAPATTTSGSDHSHQHVGDRQGRRQWIVRSADHPHRHRQRTARWCPSSTAWTPSPGCS